MGISMWQLLIILLIVVLLFGTKKLKNIGNDLGGAVKGFKKALDDEDKAKPDEKARLEQDTKDDIIEGTATKTEDKVEVPPSSKQS